MCGTIFVGLQTYDGYRAWIPPPPNVKSTAQRDERGTIGLARWLLVARPALFGVCTSYFRGWTTFQNIVQPPKEVGRGGALWFMDDMSQGTRVVTSKYKVVIHEVQVTCM